MTINKTDNDYNLTDVTSPCTEEIDVLTIRDNEVDIFSEDPDKLKEISEFLDKILPEVMVSDK